MIVTPHANVHPRSLSVTHSDHWGSWVDIVIQVCGRHPPGDVDDIIIDARYVGHLPDLSLEATAPPHYPNFYAMAKIVRVVLLDISRKGGHAKSDVTHAKSDVTTAISMGLNLGLIAGFTGVIRLRNEREQKTAMQGIIQAANDLAHLRVNDKVAMTVGGSTFQQELSDIRRARSNMTYWWLDRAATVITEMLVDELPYTEERLSIVDDAHCALWDAEIAVYRTT